MVASHGGHGLFYFMTGVSGLVHNHLDALEANRGNLLVFSQGHSGPSVALFILIDILQPLLTARFDSMTVVGGFFFGSLWGRLYLNIGRPCTYRSTTPARLEVGTLYENSPPEHA